MATLQNRNIGPVLIVDLSKIHTGTEVRVFEIARALHGRIPYAVAVLKDSALHRELVDAHLVALPFPFSKADPRLLLAIIREIHKQGFTVVDAHNAQSQFWGLLAAKIANVPLKVSTVHASYRILYRGPKGWLYEKVLKLNAKWKCHFIAVSDSVYEYLQRIGVDSKDISLIYNGIRLSEWASQTQKSSLRESLGWGENTFVVITVGSLRPVKGHRYLIDALSRVIKDRPKIRCIFVGEGRSRKELELQVKMLKIEKYIHFAGFHKDIKALLNEGNAFCLPSLSEALPFAVLEACACRLPLLVSAVGDLSKLFVNGKTAVLVPPGDPEALAKGLIHLIDNPEKVASMADEAYKMVREKLSPEKMITKTMEVYEGRLTSENL